MVVLHAGSGASLRVVSMIGEYSDLNRKTYDRIAEQYAGVRGHTRWETTLWEPFLRSVPERGVVLDLGCGPGVEALHFESRGYRVVGIDLSLEMLRIARGRTRATLAQGDIVDLPLADHVVDGIWCSATLLHVPHDQTQKVLDGMARVLSARGVLALITTEGAGSVCEPVPYSSGDYRWYFGRAPGPLEQQLTAACFRVTEYARDSRTRDWLELLAVNIES